jgi:hypothetical protein
VQQQISTGELALSYCLCLSQSTFERIINSKPCGHVLRSREDATHEPHLMILLLCIILIDANLVNPKV